MRHPQYAGRYPTICCEQSPRPADSLAFEPYACTKRTGHKDEHVATSLDPLGRVSVVAVWPNYEEAE